MKVVMIRPWYMLINYDATIPNRVTIDNNSIIVWTKNASAILPFGDVRESLK